MAARTAAQTAALPADADFLVEIDSKWFPAVGDAPAHEAVRGLRLSARRGEFVALVGPSGCGKTTTLNIAAGLDPDFKGCIRLPTAPGRSRPVLGYMFQNPRLLPWRTVYQNLALVLDGGPDADARIAALLEAVGLTAVRDQYPGRLSVGMARRAALARAFVVQPDLLLMDEPFVSLDEPTAQRLRAILLDVWHARPTTVLFVTHNLREAIQLADRLVLLSAAPTRVLADLPVDLPRDRRNDEAAVEAFRADLLSRAGPAFRLLG
jgi:ABC-type nitrate/sulfonate/bicarbonate transport system ATPase subunit